jgi:hypothetical protein
MKKKRGAGAGEFIGEVCVHEGANPKQKSREYHDALVWIRDVLVMDSRLEVRDDKWAPCVRKRKKEKRGRWLLGCCGRQGRLALGNLWPRAVRACAAG